MPIIPISDQSNNQSTFEKNNHFFFINKKLLIILNQNATNFKKKRKYKNQTRSAEGKYESKKVCQHNIIIDNYSSGSLDMIEHGEKVNCENYDELNFFDSGDSELDVDNERG